MWLFEGKEYLLGRSDDCDIVLDDPSVSRYHARISARNGVWQLQDHTQPKRLFFKMASVLIQLALARLADVTAGSRSMSHGTR